MNIKKILLSISACLLFLLSAFAQSEHKSLREGDAAYNNKDFTKAEEEYLRAIERNPESVKGHYNRGNSIYRGLSPNMEQEQRKERLDKAAAEYLSAIEYSKNDFEKAAAYHNLGNTYMEKQDLKKGIEAYKNALRLSPKDMDTKKNLAYAQRLLQQQQQQQQGEGNGDGEGKPQDNPDEQKPNEQDSNEKPSDGSSSEDPKESDKEQESGQSGSKEEEQPTPEEMSKEEVLRQLKVMDEEEQKVREKLKKEQRSEYRSEKDW